LAERSVERILEAERLEKQARDRPEEIVKWLKAKRPHRGYEVSYTSREDIKGDLMYTHCGKVFNMIRLDAFISLTNIGVDLR